MKVFTVTHIHSHGEDTNFIYAEDTPDVIDLAIHDRACYEPNLEHETIMIDPLPFLIEKHLDCDALAEDLESRIDTEYGIIPLASPEDRKTYLDELDEFQREMVERYPLRD